jgi:CheY-like chemotaxis protein
VSAPRILVVDDDAWILRMISTVLSKRGYEIITAADGQEGFERAVAKTPDLIITDIMMPKLDGWSLVKHLRSRPEFAFVPVIFLSALGSDEDRIKGFRLGADDYMPKPFRFEELDLRVAKALRQRSQVETSARQQAQRQTKDAVGLHGTLQQLGLSSVLTILEMERKSGVLVVARPSHETGRCFMSRGRIVRARIDGQVAPVNADAVYYMLTWNEGAFEFTVFEVDMDDEVNMALTALLMEGARRMDEANK